MILMPSLVLKMKTSLNKRFPERHPSLYATGKVLNFPPIYVIGDFT
jgi:hypothetical protein